MDLLRFRKNQKYFIFDTETESLNLRYSRPWQFAGQLYEGRKLLEEFDLMVEWPNLRLSKGAAMITNFRMDKYQARAIKPEIAWDKIKNIFLDPDVLLVGHNIIGFDIFQMENWLHNIGVENDWSFVDRCIDTNCLAKGIEINEQPDSKDLTAWMFKMSSFHRRGIKTSLGYLAKKYEIEVEDSRLHDALYDIGINAKVFFKQIYDIEI